MLPDNFGYILETNIDVGPSSNRIQFNWLTPLCHRIARRNFRSTAQEQPGLDHSTALCCANSRRNLFMATARNPDVFLRSMPSRYWVLEYHCPQKSRTISAL